jgi:demethylmenaquinone methyltransferase/2-methoxy-6-polyprenyl-1,4-benzoquinol methylase
MLDVGRERAIKQHLEHQVRFVEGNAEELPFADKSLTPIRSPSASATCRASTGAGGSLSRAEARQRFLCLEFSTVDVPLLDKIYDLFSFKVIPPLGKAVTGDAESYQYLVESIRKFPKPPELSPT